MKSRKKLPGSGLGINATVAAVSWPLNVKPPSADMLTRMLAVLDLPLVRLLRLETKIRP